ncbi:MAG: hypothetical protein ACI9C1_001721 [Candidatus Aldehydirespiratoraceae bacterium]
MGKGHARHTLDIGPHAVVIRLEEGDVMATGRSSFAKRQRDMAKKAKASAKRDRKLEKGEEGYEEDLEDEVVDDGPKPSNDQIMEKVADLHRRYDDGQLDLDSFDEERANLMGQISVD